MSARPARQQRVFEERADLAGKIERLDAWLQSPTCADDDAERARKVRQLAAMALYMSALTERIGAFQ